MGLALLVVGIVLVLSAIRGYTAELGKLVRGDFTGSGSFGLWAVAIVILSAIGGIGGGAKTLSRAFLGLVFIVLIFANKGVFANLLDAIQNPPAPLPVNVPTVASGSAGVSSSSGGAAGAVNSATGLVNSVASSAPLIASFFG